MWPNQALQPTAGACRLSQVLSSGVATAWQVINNEDSTDGQKLAALAVFALSAWGAKAGYSSWSSARAAGLRTTWNFGRVKVQLPAEDSPNTAYDQAVADLVNNSGIQRVAVGDRRPGEPWEQNNLQISLGGRFEIPFETDPGGRSHQGIWRVDELGHLGFSSGDPGHPSTVLGASRAYAGGEAKFTGQNEVTINFFSGRIPGRTTDMRAAAIRLWRALGYTVNIGQDTQTGLGS